MHVPEDEPLSPDDWHTEHHRTYADRQAALAEACGVNVESRAIDTDAAGRVHYLVAGDPEGEPVVLLHGINMPGGTWLPLVPALTDEYRVYVPDRPGRGLSATYQYSRTQLREQMTTYLHEAFEAWGLDRPPVVANSLGGIQAFLLALDDDLVQRLVLVGAPGGLDTNVGVFYRLLTLRGFSHFFDWLAYRDDSIESIRDRLTQFSVTDGSAVPTELYELLAAQQGIPGSRKSERSLAHAESFFGRLHPIFDLSDGVVDLSIPTCFVWGTDDEFWEPDAGRPIAQQMNAEFHELPDHGHMPWLEPDEQASGHVRSFLDG